MNSKVYKWCAVPQCKNTSIKTPNKVFVHVPNKKIIRQEWLKLARRNPNDVATNSPLYFCEDHFDLPNDMENYMQYHVMGSVSQVRMKPGCVPHKFACQPDRITRITDTTERPYIAKKRRMKISEECIKEFEEKRIVMEQSSSEEIAPSSSVKKNIRDTWLNLAGRDPASVSLNSVIYFCEDHFDLPNDMENYMQYHVMGKVSQVRMKPGCVPTRFECQQDRRKHNRKRPCILKKQRNIPIKDREKDFARKNTLAKHLELSPTLSECSGSSAQHDTANASTVNTIKNKVKAAGITKKNSTKCTAKDPLEVDAGGFIDIKTEASEEEKIDVQVEIKIEHDANEDVVSRGVGVCQCCLSTGEHALLDIPALLDCFNLTVDIFGPPLVCDTCEQFLQRARLFRAMVVNSQMRLKQGLTQVKKKGASLLESGKVQGTLGVEQSGHTGAQKDRVGAQQSGLCEAQVDKFKDHQITLPERKTMGLVVQQIEVPTAQNEEIVALQTKLRGVPEKILRVQQGGVSTVQQQGLIVLESEQNPAVWKERIGAEQSGHMVQEELSLQQVRQPMVQLNELIVDKNAFVRDKIETRIPIVQGPGVTERPNEQKIGQKVQKKPREHEVQKNIQSEPAQKRMKIPIIPLSRPPWLQEGDTGSQEGELVMRRTKPKILRRGPTIKRGAQRSCSSETTVQQMVSAETTPQESSHTEPRLFESPPPCESPPLAHREQQDKVPGLSVNQDSTIYVNEEGIVKLEFYCDNENMEEDMKPLAELSPTRQQ